MKKNIPYIVIAITIVVLIYQFFFASKTETTKYPNGIVESVVNYSGQSLDGYSTYYTRNGDKEKEILYDGGDEVEVVEWQYDYRTKVSQKTHKNETQETFEINWHSNGEKSLELGYVKGKRQGIKQTWHENGNIASKGIYKHDLLEGKSQKWHSNGEKSLELGYVQGKRQGIKQTWHENGNIASKGIYKHDLLEGKSQKWHDNGQKSSEGNYTNDVKAGIHITWHGNGVKGSELLYTQGKLEGNVKRWNENNSIVEDSTYVDGVRSKAVEWKYSSNEQMISKANFINNAKEGVQTTWHDNGIKSTSGNYTNNQKNGVYTTWFDNKTKATEGKYTAGSKEDVHTVWHKNGKKRSEENFTKNKYSGLSIYWSDKGLKIKELEKAGSITTRHTPFVDGKKHGIETLKYADGTRKGAFIYKQGQNIDVSYWYDEDGDLSRQKNYQKAILLSDVSYSKGARNGKTKMYYASGQLEREVDYVNNEKSGKETYYYNNGTKELEANYKDAVLDGTFINYYKSGKVHKSTAYKDGTEHGQKQVFYKNGVLHNELTFKDGEKDGRVVWYYENGALDQAIHYDNGARNDDKLEVYIPTSTGSLSLDAWLIKNLPIARFTYKKGMTGPVVRRDSEGRLSYIANYVDGLKTGITTYFHSNSRKKREVTWKNAAVGKNYVKHLNGKLTDWNKNGNKTYEAYYKSNRDSVKNYINSENSDNRNNEFYKKNIYGAYLHGVQTYFNGNGTLRTIRNQVNNRKTGLHTTFYTNGRKKREMTWRNSLSEYVKDLNGKLTDWNKNGNKTYEAYYKSNRDSVKNYINSENSDNRNNEFYKKNIYGAYLHGVQTYFNGNGKATKRIIWKNNKAR